MIGLTLLFASLPGPWLTIALPVGVAFVLHDRRPGARVAAGLVALAAAAMAAAGPGGIALLVAAGIAIGLATARLWRGIRPDLGALVWPTIAGGGLAAGAAIGLDPDRIEAWETALGEAVGTGAGQAVDRYRDIGLDPGAIEGLESMATAAATWVVRLWPALVAVGVWLGVWFAYRMLARWGRPPRRVARHLRRRPFARTRPPDAFVWVPVLALAALWLPLDGARRAAENALLAGAVVYGLTGLAIGVWWADRANVGTGVRLVALVLLTLFLPPVLVVGCVALGVADVWIEIRERHETTSRERQGG